MAREGSSAKSADLESPNNERSRAVARVMAALEELSVAASPLSSHELALRLGVPAASMYRVLHKLAELGYLECSPSHATYGVAPKLAELGERLADAGCRAPPLRRLMAQLRAETGDTISVWVRSGVHVRLAALLVGEVRGASLNTPGELAPPFSTPGIAICSQYARDDVRTLVAHCRRRRVPLGRRYASVAELEKALREVRSRGYAAGYNLRADGWGMLAWPIPVTLAPLRIGALAIGAQVATLRREEVRLVAMTQKLITNYLHEQSSANLRPIP